MGSETNDMVWLIRRFNVESRASPSRIHDYQGPLPDQQFKKINMVNDDTTNPSMGGCRQQFLGALELGEPSRIVPACQSCRRCTTTGAGESRHGGVVDAGEGNTF